MLKGHMLRAGHIFSNTFSEKQIQIYKQFFEYFDNLEKKSSERKCL